LQGKGERSDALSVGEQGLTLTFFLTPQDCGYIYNRDECAGFYFEEQVRLTEHERFGGGLERLIN